MERRHSVFFILLLVVPILLNSSFLVFASTKKQSPDIFVGVDVAYENLTEIKKLIDEISSYTNLFVIGCTGITYNFTTLDETCQYVYDKGLSFIIYSEHMAPHTEWLEDAKKRWGDHFLGFYAYDEVGGRQVDLQKYRVVHDADNYTDAASQFVDGMNWILKWYTQQYTNSTNFPLFTSDYALYWFDYKAGYDVVLAQFGWNYSRQLNVALCRGAAKMQNKDWGVMITWTYNDPPYIESGGELYEDLILAYENGAKYIVVFDSNENYTQGILEEEHLEALKEFWQYIQNNPRKSDSSSDRVAFVLPKDYAYGFRGPNDKIWGLWEADTFSKILCYKLNIIMEKYGFKMDIIYDDGLEPGSAYGYSKLISWNSTPFPFFPLQSTLSPEAELNPFLNTVFAYTMVAGAAAIVIAAAALAARKRDKTTRKKTIASNSN